MRTRRQYFFVLSLLASCYVAVAGCSDDEESSTPVASEAGPDVATDATPQDTSRPDALDARSPEYTGSACTAASECYGDLDAASLKGEAVCIDKVTDGYCTHKCTTDEDCCAVPGECRTGLKQVCAPFENTDEKYCFLSCEQTDIAAATDAGASDAGMAGDDYCKANSSDEFGCRSTGGGAENRAVCLPTGPAGDGGKKDSGLDADLDAPIDG